MIPSSLRRNAIRRGNNKSCYNNCSSIISRVALQSSSRNVIKASNFSSSTLLSPQLSTTTSTPSLSITAPKQNIRAFSSQQLKTEEEDNEDDNILIQPSNLKIDIRSTISPFYGLKKIEYEEYDDEEEQLEGSGEEKTTTASADVDEQTHRDEELEEYDEEYDDDEEYYEDDEEEVLYDLSSKQINEELYVKPLPERLNVDVWDFQTNESSGKLWLSPEIFGIDDIRIDILHKVVHYQRNKKRGKRNPGSISKTRGTRAGSNRKVRPQKGQGTARAGDRRPPHWRKGGVAHGSKGKEQDFTTKINKKVKVLGIKNALSQKLKENNLILVNNFTLKDHKTKHLMKILNDNWNIANKKNEQNDICYKAYMLDHVLKNKDNDPEYPIAGNNVPAFFKIASQNLYQIKVSNQIGLNVYDMLRHDKLVLSVSALQEIEQRLLK